MQFEALYSFNEDGMLYFEQIMRGKISDEALDPVEEGYVSKVAGTGPFTVVPFATAKEMAEQIIISLQEQRLFPLLGNQGLWAWLTYILRDQLFKKSKDGVRKIGEDPKWLPSDPNDYRKAQRHLVRMPVLLLDSLGSDADHLLCSPPHVHGEIREQLTSQQDMFNQTFQAAAKSLYFDPVTGGLKRGAGGKSGGSPRRLAKVRYQFDWTWELEDLGPQKILSMLPSEFDKFLPTHTE